MRKHSVIIGAGGRLGSALHKACTRLDHQVTGLSRQELDLQDETAVQSVLAALDYDTLWLTAALTDVDYCEKHPDQAEQVNSIAVREIARISEKKGAKVIFFSTDYVFDGQKNSPYEEGDATHPLSVYGQSKLNAEQHVIAASSENLVVRLSWLFGNQHPGFPEWVIGKAMQEAPFAVVTDRRSSPSYTEDVIVALEPLIRGKIDFSGILHLCNQEIATWHEWAQYCLECAQQSGIELKTPQAGTCQMSDIKSFAAQRPVFSAMSTARYESLSGSSMPHWKDAVKRYITDHLVDQFTK